MKAFLLAAGLGTRLKPYTDTTPKCLMPICGKPLLGIWLDHLEKCGITEVLVNTHHLADKVSDYLYSERSRKIGIVTSHEETLLGSAGTVFENKAFIGDDNPFIIAYADNLTDADIKGLADLHRRVSPSGSVLTMGLIKAPDPKKCGIVTINGQGLITDFTEKPENPESDLANCGIYVTDRRIFDYYPLENPEKHVIDFGYDILPVLKGKMHGFRINGYLRDIGTVESYCLACSEWPDLINKKH